MAGARVGPSSRSEEERQLQPENRTCRRGWARRNGPRCAPEKRHTRKHALVALRFDQWVAVLACCLGQAISGRFRAAVHRLPEVVDETLGSRAGCMHSATKCTHRIILCGASFCWRRRSRCKMRNPMYSLTTQPSGVCLPGPPDSGSFAIEFASEDRVRVIHVDHRAQARRNEVLLAVGAKERLTSSDQSRRRPGFGPAQHNPEVSEGGLSSPAAEASVARSQRSESQRSSSDTGEATEALAGGSGLPLCAPGVPQPVLAQDRRNSGNGHTGC